MLVTKLNAELVEAKFLRRLNRFRIQVQMKGVEDVCLPNPGRMKELLHPDAAMLLVEHQGSSRKTAYDAIAVLHRKVWVCIDSRIPNKIVQDEIRKKGFPEFTSYRSFHSEFRINHSRIDFLLSGKPNCLLEVKGCTLVKDRVAIFPDAPTERGTRHLKELTNATRQGYLACILFLIQRPDAERFAPNASTDPKFTAALSEAFNKGVEVLAYTSAFSRDRITLGRKVPIHLKPAEIDP